MESTISNGQNGWERLHHGPHGNDRKSWFPWQQLGHVTGYDVKGQIINPFRTGGCLHHHEVEYETDGIFLAIIKITWVLIGKLLNSLFNPTIIFMI
jgi:hypothetical protein